MPTYEYRCAACGHEFELFQSMSASVKRKCPECKTLKLERLIGTGAAVIFKGGGFYETDYRSESYNKAAQADKKKQDDAAKPAADASKESSATSDSKSDSKSESKPTTNSDAKQAAKSAAKSATKPEAKPASKSKPKKPTK